MRLPRSAAVGTAVLIFAAGAGRARAAAQLPAGTERVDSGSVSTASPETVWRSLFTFYLDNTEFFTPYRLGETILGSQFTTALVIEPRPRVQLLVGAFGDYRYGSRRFLDQVKPVLSFRWRATTPSRETTGVLGTLITERRHGFLEPLQATTFELTRPVEYGGQWFERHRWIQAEAFLNWQQLLRRSQREVFDYGGTLALTPASWLRLEGQLHGVHRGGQRYDGTEPVANNVVDAVGARVIHPLPLLGQAELAVFHVRGRGSVDLTAAESEPKRGEGNYARGSIAPWRWGQLVGIYWRARNFLSAEGDPNYSSGAFTYSRYFQSHRTYIELGVLQRIPIDRGLGLDAEFRLHRMDHQPITDPVSGTTWEYSYRLVARIPVEVRLGR